MLTQRVATFRGPSLVPRQTYVVVQGVVSSTQASIKISILYRIMPSKFESFAFGLRYSLHQI